MKSGHDYSAARPVRLLKTRVWPAVMRVIGIEHTKLTWRHNGIDRRLTDVHGHVIQGILS